MINTEWVNFTKEYFGEMFEHILFRRTIVDESEFDEMLSFICSKDYYKCIEQIISMYKNSYSYMLTKTLDNPCNALHIACRDGSHNIVNILINANVDINKVCEAGFTPLQYAVISGHMYIITRLINSGADVNVQINGKTLKDLAIENDHLMLVDYIDSLTKCHIPPIKDVILADNAIYLAAHVNERKYNVDALIDGLSTLDFAITNNRCKTVAYLLSKGAVVTCFTSMTKNTSLTRACYNCCPECVENVLTAGEIVKDQTINDTVIWCRNGSKTDREKCIILLHKHGFNIDTSRDTPLLKRILRNNMSELLRYAIGAKLVDVTGKQMINDCGVECSVMRYAHNKCTKKIIKILLDNNANCTEYLTNANDGPFNEHVLAIKNHLITQQQQTLDEIMRLIN